MVFKTERADLIAQQLEKLSIVKTVPVYSWKVKEGFFVNPAEADAAQAPWTDFNGQVMTWGGYDKHVWFRTEVEVPAEFDGKPFYMGFTTEKTGWEATNPQMLIFINGEVVQAADTNHRDVKIADKAVVGTKYKVDVQAYAGLFETKPQFITNMKYIDATITKAYYDLQVAVETAKVLDPNDYNRVQIENILEKAVNLLDMRENYSAEFFKGLEAMSQYLDENLYNNPEYDEILSVGIGHTHIDIAWLWTVAQTREKAIRSFSTVLKLMDEYPDYKFMSSQPILYQMVKERYPEVYEKIAARIAEGRWEPEGGMWLEADCNVTSGESLVRQFLHGKKFFKDEFGKDNKILWLPDVFGYSAALPQICKKSGIDYFMTTKITWNQFNKFPYDTFQWKGIDGTELFTHFGTAIDSDILPDKWMTTYNARVNPKQVKGSWDRYQQKEINNEALISFGFGDGGGGPTREMLENAKRLDKGVKGLPNFKQQFSREYFDKLYEKVKDDPNLPTWVGELYLEYHRGTYTSMSRNKKSNRKNEFLWQDAEFFSTWAEQFGSEYPSEEIYKSWETILLNQFHDILPGSSIKEVYDVTKEEYDALEARGQEIVAAKAKVIADHIPSDQDGVVVFNTLSFDRDDVVTLPADMVSTQSFTDCCGNAVPTQKTADGNYVVSVKGIPAKGYKVLKVSNAANPASPFTVSDGKIDTPFYTIAYNQNGQFTSIYDKKAGREVLKPGTKGNVLKVFENKPMNYDNWDIDVFYQEKGWEVDKVTEIKWIEEGPVRATLQVKWDFMGTPIEQKIHFYADDARIDFDTYTDWKLVQYLLKVEFPVDVNASTATYDIQFGNVERPTHWNTSWDLARFEVCAHKWADVSEQGYGVSLLNDCKYGHDIKDSVMRLTLVKAGNHPQISDIEEHTFVYSLYPHVDGWREADTVKEAYKLNVPVYPVAKKADAKASGAAPQFISVCGDNVVMEVVKKAVDGNGTIIRLYEYENKRANVSITFSAPVSSVCETNLIEEDMKQLQVKDNGISFEIKPFEIKTFRVK